MYAAALGIDWTTLEREELLHRSFALGVAAACGYHDSREYERLQTAVDRAYDRSLVELAYSEGKQKASKLRRETADAEEIWKALVEETSTSISDSLDRTTPPSRFDLPPSVLRTDLLDRPRSDSRDAVQLPPFLRRE